MEKYIIHDAQLQKVSIYEKDLKVYSAFIFKSLNDQNNTINFIDVKKLDLFDDNCAVNLDYIASYKFFKIDEETYYVSLDPDETVWKILDTDSGVIVFKDLEIESHKEGSILIPNRGMDNSLQVFNDVKLLSNAKVLKIDINGVASQKQIKITFQLDHQYNQNVKLEIAFFDVSKYEFYDENGAIVTSLVRNYNLDRLSESNCRFAIDTSYSTALDLSKNSIVLEFRHCEVYT